MKATTSSLTKLLFATLLSTSLISLTLPAVASVAPTDEITGSGQVLSKVGGSYGAYVNSMTNGATITTDLTNANVNIYGNGSTLTWQYLNTAPGQSLNFNFNAAGQYAVNNVVGSSMSRFAGSLTSSGEAGRVIISNPNGMLFENGSYTNVNALTLTTKYVNWDGNLNGQLDLYSKSTSGKITIGNGDTSNMAVMRIAEDLTVVAPNIAVNVADIKTGIGPDGNILTDGKGDIRLITSDGVTFYAVDAIPESGDKFATVDYNSGNYGDITIQRASLSIEDSATGKIYLIAKRNLNVKDGSDLNNVLASAGNNINITDSNVYSSELYATNNITLNNSYAESSSLDAGNYMWLKNGSSIYDTYASSVNEMYVYDSNISSSQLYTDRNLYLSNSYAEYSKLAATGYLSIYNWSEIVDSSVTANKIILTDSYASKVNLTGVISVALNNSIVEGKSVLTSSAEIAINNGSQLSNSTAKAQNGIKITSSYVDSSSLISGNWIKVFAKSTIDSSSLVAKGAIIANSSVINDSYLYSGTNINFDFGSSINNCKIYDANSIYVTTGSQVNDSSLGAGLDINLQSSSAVYNSMLAAGRNINITDSNINDSDLYASKNIKVTDSVFENNFTSAEGIEIVSSPK